MKYWLGILYIPFPFYPVMHTSSMHIMDLKGSYNYWAESVVLSGLKSYENWYTYVWPWWVQAFLHNPWFSILQFVADVNNNIMFFFNNLRQLQSLWNTILREIRSFTYFFLKYQTIIVYICHKLSEQNQGLWKNACNDHGHTHINFHVFKPKRTTDSAQ